MTKQKYMSKLGLKFASVAGIALIVALCMFLTLYEGLTWWLINGDQFDPYWDKECREAIMSFQSYVTENGLTVDEAVRDIKWEQEYQTVFLYFSFSPVEYAGDEPNEKIPGTPVHCEDGSIFAYAFSAESHYYHIGLVASVVISACGFFVILLPYVYRIINRITDLGSEMDILTGGDLAHSIVCDGEDELSELGRNIESMRLSVIRQMARENEAVLSNSRLITSLSHDLRTPLTRLTGYLEILRLKQDGTSPENERYISLAIDNAQRMKELSDQMFSHFDVERQTENVLLSQIISDMCFDLQDMGFNAEPPVIEGEFTLSAPPLDIKRIIDNLFSNIKKYADKSKPVSISVKTDNSRISIIAQNQIGEYTDTQSNGLGLPTIKNLAEKNGGKAETSTKEGSFTATIELPIII